MARSNSSLKSRDAPPAPTAGATAPRLTVLSPGGPALAYHVGCVAGGALYVHGGVDKARSTAPLNELHRYDFEGGAWERLRAEGAPALSHHAAVVVDDRSDLK